MRAQVGQGLYAASEWSAFVGATAAWARDGTLRGLLHFHGHGGDSRACRDYTNPDLLGMSNTIAGTYPLLSIDAGGSANWGNGTAVARAADGFTYLTGTWGAKTDKILIWGDSMGALGALNWAVANPTKVAAIALTRPVLDLNDMVNNNRGGFAAEINTVYGARSDSCGTTNGASGVTDASITTGDGAKAVYGPGIPNNSKIGSVVPATSFSLVNQFSGSSVTATATQVSVSLQIGGYNEAVHGPTYNPNNYGAALNGIPIHIWNATDDTIAVPAAVTTFLARCPSAAATSVGTVGHGGTVSAVDKTELMAFLATYA